MLLGWTQTGYPGRSSSSGGVWQHNSRQQGKAHKVDIDGRQLSIDS